MPSVPSISPSLNWRRTSSITEPADLPTASMVKPLKTYGAKAPMSKPGMTMLVLLVSTISATRALLSSPETSFWKATKRASAVKIAEVIANPLPVAAVVFPRASRASVLSLTIGSSSAISAIPPALSTTGPYASVARVIPRVANMPTALIATPYTPARLKLITMSKVTITIGGIVENMPTARPRIKTVAGPVSADFAMLWTGAYAPEVQYSVAPPTMIPATRPKMMTM
mmetsp:Transcript_14209/g.40301  ORF Transcript_14209/g.40301 Transcript_14209/m.40301 type:complete len:228 (-) Transcript_14209:1626-2309(-)